MLSVRPDLSGDFNMTCLMYVNHPFESSPFTKNFSYRVLYSSCSPIEILFVMMYHCTTIAGRGSRVPGTCTRCTTDQSRYFLRCEYVRRRSSNTYAHVTRCTRVWHSDRNKEWFLCFYLPLYERTGSRQTCHFPTHTTCNIHVVISLFYSHTRTIH